MSYKIDVVIVTKDRPVALLRAIKSILANTHKPAKIIVIDSSQSRNNLRSRVDRLSKKFGIDVVYKSGFPLGLARARNEGISRSTAAIVGFLDDDEIAPKHWLASVNTFFVQHKNAQMVTGPRLPANLHNYWHRLWGQISTKDYSTMIGRSFLTSDNAFFKKSFLKKYHLAYDENLSFAFEDFALSQRILKTPHAMYRCDDISVYHDVRSSSFTFFKQWYLYGRSNAEYHAIYLNMRGPNAIQKRLYSLVWLWEDYQKASVMYKPGYAWRAVAYLLGYILRWVVMPIRRGQFVRAG